MSDAYLDEGVVDDGRVFSVELVRDEAVCVDALEDVVRVVFHRCGEDHDLVVLAELAQEVAREGPHEEELFLLVEVDERLVQVQHDGVGLLAGLRRQQHRQLDESAVDGLEEEVWVQVELVLLFRGGCVWRVLQRVQVWDRRRLLVRVVQHEPPQLFFFLQLDGVFQVALLGRASGGARRPELAGLLLGPFAERFGRVCELQEGLGGRRGGGADVRLQLVSGGALFPECDCCERVVCRWLLLVRSQSGLRPVFGAGRDCCEQGSFFSLLVRFEHFGELVGVSVGFALFDEVLDLVSLFGELVRSSYFCGEALEGHESGLLDRDGVDRVGEG